jgi:hypothetical protein
MGAMSEGDWLKRLALPPSIAIMDLGWLAPWLLLVGFWLEPGRAAPLLPAPSILAPLLGGRAAMRLSRGRRWPLPRVRVALVGLGVLAVLLAVCSIRPGWLGWPGRRRSSPARGCWGRGRDALCVRDGAQPAALAGRDLFPVLVAPS